MAAFFIIPLSRNGVHTHISHAPVPNFVVFPSYLFPSLPVIHAPISNHFFVFLCDFVGMPNISLVCSSLGVCVADLVFSALFFGLGIGAMVVVREEKGMDGI